MTLLSDEPIQPEQTPPPPANWLGYTGLIPFVAAAIGILVFRSNSEMQALMGMALLVYGAIILSFLGGIRWGAALNMRDKQGQMRQLCLSVLPALLGWICVLLPSPAIAMIALAVGFTGQLYFDLHSTALEQLPRWFGRLRVHLTIGAIVSLLFGAAQIY